MYEPSLYWRSLGVPGRPMPRPLPPPRLPGLLRIGALGFVVLAILTCCLLASRIGAERARIAQLDADIARTRLETVRLQKELAVRSRFAELDRWNATLLLSPPRADQYVMRESDLARLAARQGRVVVR